jgi:hypothetical protein
MNTLIITGWGWKDYGYAEDIFVQAVSKAIINHLVMLP